MCETVSDFADYRDHLEALNRNEGHIETTLGYLHKTAAALKWASLANLKSHDLTAHLSEQAEAMQRSPRWFNARVVAWRAFVRWCVRERRLAFNPLAPMQVRNTETDRRRVRRDIAAEEVARVIAAALASEAAMVERPVRVNGERRVTTVRLHAPDRAWAYRIAAGTGFRAGEVSSLTPESFDLDDDVPTVTVEAAFAKRKRRDEQPIRADLADLLRPWLGTKRPRERVCPLPEGKAGLLLQADMRAARAQWIDEAKTPGERAEREKSNFLRPVDSMGRQADFHSLRVHYISRVVEAGANLKEAMELARHSDPKLTLKT